MNSDHAYVRSWLEEVLGDAVPSFEMSEEGMEAIGELARASRDRERRMAVVDEVRRRQAAEYAAEADRMAKGLAEIGVAPEQLPGPAEKLTEVLAEVAQILDVDHPEEVAISLALGEVLDKTARIPLEDLEREEEEKELQKGRLSALERVSKSQDQLRAEEKEAVKRKDRAAQAAKKAAFLREKQRDYARAAAKHEQELGRGGMRTELRHEKLRAAAEEVAKLEEEELAPLREKLRGFQSLPPDLELAKLKVAEAEEELAELTQKLTSEINMLHI